MNTKTKSIIASLVAVSSLLAVSSILVNQKSAPTPTNSNKIERTADQNRSISSRKTKN